MTLLNGQKRGSLCSFPSQKLFPAPLSLEKKRSSIALVENMQTDVKKTTYLSKHWFFSHWIIIFLSTNCTTVTKLLTGLERRLLYHLISSKIPIHFSRAGFTQSLFHSMPCLEEESLCSHFISCTDSCVCSDTPSHGLSLHLHSGTPSYLYVFTSQSSRSWRSILLLSVKTLLWPSDFAVLSFQAGHFVFVLLRLYFKVHCSLCDLK